MSKGMSAYVAQQQAKIEAAGIMSTAMALAFKTLEAANVEGPEKVMSEILGADTAE